MDNGKDLRSTCTPDAFPFRNLSLKIGSDDIHEIESYKILGTLLDNELRFDLPFEQAVKSAYSAFYMVKNFVIGSKINVQDSMVKLYKCLIRARTDFSVVAITNISKASINALETLQRTCLLFASGCLPQSSSEVLNTITKILPIDLHLKKRSAELLVRIASKKSVVNDYFRIWRQVNCF